MKNTYLILISGFFLICLWPVAAITYQYKTDFGHPGGSVDAPNSWDRYIDQKKNTSIILFSDDKNPRAAFIELRLQQFDAEPDFDELMHETAARLATRFTFVELIKEQPSEYRSEMYLADWQIQEKGFDYKTKTALLIKGKSVLSLVLMAETDLFNNYNVIFENAILSLNFLNQ